MFGDWMMKEKLNNVPTCLSLIATSVCLALDMIEKELIILVPKQSTVTADRNCGVIRVVLKHHEVRLKQSCARLRRLDRRRDCMRSGMCNSKYEDLRLHRLSRFL